MRRTLLLVALAGGLLSGCGSAVKEIRHHPGQARLDGILDSIVSHTKYPHRHYWIRVSEPLKHHLGVASMSQRHIYVSEPLLDEADDAVLTALVAHALAHHRLHHHRKRTMLGFAQRLAFKAGGFFVPGLSHGHRVGGPLAEVAMSAGQEPSADRKTVELLEKMGHSAQDLRRALEFLRDHGYTERVGRIVVKDREFTNRIRRLDRPDEGGGE